MPTFILLSVGILLIIPKIKRSETHNFGNYHICERIIYRFSVAARRNDARGAQNFELMRHCRLIHIEHFRQIPDAHFGNADCRKDFYAGAVRQNRKQIRKFGKDGVVGQIISDLDLRFIIDKRHGFPLCSHRLYLKRKPRFWVNLSHFVAYCIFKRFSKGGKYV